MNNVGVCSILKLFDNKSEIYSLILIVNIFSRILISWRTLVEARGRSQVPAEDEAWEIVSQGPGGRLPFSW
jgi:hypothetical protein